MTKEEYLAAKSEIVSAIKALDDQLCYLKTGTRKARRDTSTVSAALAWAFTFPWFQREEARASKEVARLHDALDDLKHQREVAFWAAAAERLLTVAGVVGVSINRDTRVVTAVTGPEGVSDDAAAAATTLLPRGISLEFQVSRAYAAVVRYDYLGVPPPTD